MAETAVVTSTIELGSVAAIPPGQGRCYVVSGEQVAVFRQRDGRLFATQNLCPHKQGPLAEGILGDGRVICPLHAHQFDLETGTGGEGAECLRVHGIQEIDGNMRLNFRSPQ